MVEIKVFGAGDDWANRAYYSLEHGGVTVECDARDGWDEVAGREDGEEYVTLRVDSVADARARLSDEGFRVEVA